MIPDIAFMIVVYGSARLVTAALEPYRRSAGRTVTDIATALTWVTVIVAVGALAYLGYDVFRIASSATGTGGLT